METHTTKSIFNNKLVILIIAAFIMIASSGCSSIDKKELGRIVVKVAESNDLVHKASRRITLETLDRVDNKEEVAEILGHAANVIDSILERKADLSVIEDELNEILSEYDEKYSKPAELVVSALRIFAETTIDTKFAELEEDLKDEEKYTIIKGVLQKLVRGVKEAIDEFEETGTNTE